MHPAAPSDLGELIEAYSNTGQAVLDLGLTCHDDDFARETQCPGWTVQDQIAHVVGLEAIFNGAEQPDIEVPDHPWIKSDFGRFMETHVEARRDGEGPAVVAEWQELFPQRVAVLHEMLALDPDEPIETPVGPRRPSDLVSLRTVDIWCHEQDIRQALNRPGNLDSPGAALFSQRLFTALPILAARSGLPVGSTVIVETTGPVQGRGGVRIVERDGKPYGEELFSGDSYADDAHEGEATTIRLTTEAFTRRGAGRIPTSELRYAVDGDEDLARMLLDAIAVTP